MFSRLESLLGLRPIARGSLLDKLSESYARTIYHSRDWMIATSSDGAELRADVCLNRQLESVMLDLKLNCFDIDWPLTNCGWQ